VVGERRRRDALIVVARAPRRVPPHGPRVAHIPQARAYMMQAAARHVEDRRNCNPVAQRVVAARVSRRRGID
jgi:hypothetical protein